MQINNIQNNTNNFNFKMSYYGKYAGIHGNAAVSEWQVNYERSLKELEKNMRLHVNDLNSTVSFFGVSLEKVLKDLQDYFTKIYEIDLKDINSNLSDFDKILKNSLNNFSINLNESYQSSKKTADSIYEEILNRTKEWESSSGANRQENHDYQQQANQHYEEHGGKYNQDTDAIYEEYKLLQKQTNLDYTINLFVSGFDHVVYSKYRNTIADALDLSLADLSKLYLKDKTLYRKLALKYHPDRNKSPLAQKQFTLLNIIYNK